MRVIARNVLSVLSATLSMGFSASLSHRSSMRKTFRPMSHAAKGCISVIVRTATVSEAGGMGRTGRHSRSHRPIFTAFRPF